MFEQFIHQLYQSILGRQADSAGLSYWAAALQSGEMSASEITEQFITSSEHDQLVEPVARVYLATFNRAPDASGLAHWVGAYREGVALDEIVQGFMSSAEYQTIYGQTSNIEFITLMYQNALNRVPEQTGVQFWTSLLDSGLPRSALIKSFSGSVEITQVRGQEIQYALLQLALTGETPALDQIRSRLPITSWTTLIESIYTGPSYDGPDVPGLDRYVPPEPQPEPTPEPFPEPAPAPDTDPGPVPVPDTTPPVITSFTVSSDTTLSVTSSEAGMARLVDNGSVISSAALILPNVAYSLSVFEQSSQTETQLVVTDNFGNSVVSPIRVVLGTTGNDNFIQITDSADYVFGFAGNNRYVYTSMSAFMPDGAITDWIQGGSSGDAIVIQSSEVIAINISDSFSRADNIDTLAISSANENPISIILGASALAAGIVNVSLAGDTDPIGNNIVDVSSYNTRGDVEILGSSGSDTILGGESEDRIEGGLGEDLINAGEGYSNVFLDAGIGADIVIHNSVASSIDIFVTGNDLVTLTATQTGAYVMATGGISGNVDASTSSAKVYMASGNNDPTIGMRFTGGSGDDDIYGYRGSDTLIGGAGNDTIGGQTDSDIMTGGEGSDVFVIYSEIDVSSDSNQTLSDTITDLTPVDFIWVYLMNVNDFNVATDVFGGSGVYSVDTNSNGNTTDVSDILLSTSGINLTDLQARAQTYISAYGTTGADSISGSVNDDYIFGYYGDDQLIGNGGDDTLIGGSGNDTILGNQGNDEIAGDEGDDSLQGGQGSDSIYGGIGRDSIWGGSTGADRLTGDEDDDLFAIYTNADTKGEMYSGLNSTWDNVEAITDFSGNDAGSGDSILLGTEAEVFGAGITFTGSTVANVTALIIAGGEVANLNEIFDQINAAAPSGGIASTSAEAQIYDVTLTTEFAGANRLLIINNNVAGIANVDAVINITGVTGAMHATDFSFGLLV